MPCYNPDPTESELRKEFSHNSDVADYLCSILRYCSEKQIAVPMSPGLVKWWKEHQERDRKKNENGTR